MKISEGTMRTGIARGGCILSLVLVVGCGMPSQAEEDHKISESQRRAVAEYMSRHLEAVAPDRMNVNLDGDISPEDISTREEFLEFVAQQREKKPGVVQEQLRLLERRYDLADRPSSDTTMFKGKPIQVGTRVRLPDGMSWEDLAEMSPEAIKENELFPRGFFPLPHVDHPTGGMVFPQFKIDRLLAATGRDLNRFDVEFDIPEHFLPEFPPPMFLTTRSDLGDVSNGEIITSQNFYRLFKGILSPKQLNGLQLLVEPFKQQQFNLTFDRKSLEPSMGVACLDCHVNGHTDGSFELAADARPQAHRNRIDTPTLRGLYIQALFGSQRSLDTVEDFSQFEQSNAYFDGDVAKAAIKGVRFLDEVQEVQPMAEVQKLIDFPPAPKLGIDGRLIPSLATEAELRGENLFFGEARCGECHQAPFYTDNLMHDLEVDRFYEQQEINGMIAASTGPIKTFPLRGIKDSPPYLHDGRLLTLADTVEFFNLILGTKLSEQEKSDLVEFMEAL